MEPIGLTFKHNGFDKYGRARAGDGMLVHVCRSCGEININRIAGDDRLDVLFKVFRNATHLDAQLKARLKYLSISLLTETDEDQLNIAIYGKSYRRAALAGDP